MSPDAEQVLVELAQRFGLDASRMRQARYWDMAVANAVALMPASAVVAELVEWGDLRGARNPWGVLLSRLRELPSVIDERERRREELAESARWRKVDRAVKRGETLRALVGRGDLRLDEATEQLGADFQDDRDLFAIAQAALTGGAK